MRKLLCTILVIALILLTVSCGLSQSDDPQESSSESLEMASEQLSKPFGATANVLYNGMKIVLEFSKSAEGKSIVNFVEPALLKGMTLEADDEEITVSYLGMRFAIDPNNLAASSIAGTMVAAFNSVAAQKGVTAEIRDNALQVIGKTDDANFVMVFDRKNGNLLRLEVPSMNLSAQFENFNLF